MMKTKLGKERNFIELSTWDFQVMSRIEPSVACLPSLHLGAVSWELTRELLKWSQKMC